MAKKKKLDDMELTLRNLYKDDPKDKRNNRPTDVEKVRDAAADALSRMIDVERKR